MSQTTYETMTADAMQAQHNQYWENALASLGTPVLEVPEVSRVMPYYAAQRAAAKHVEDCEPCNSGSFLDLCPEGDALFSVASDACAAQEDLAGQN